MSSRIIRESALWSTSLAQLSDGAERLFWRLTVAADDHGRFDADPRVVLGQCFPLKIGILSPRRVARWLGEIERVDGIKIYQANGRTYGVFVNWRHYQRPPRYKSRFPTDPLSAVDSGSTSGSKPLKSDLICIGYREVNSEKGEGGKETGSDSEQSGNTPFQLDTKNASEDPTTVGSVVRRSFSALYAEEIRRREADADRPIEEARREGEEPGTE